MFRLNLVIKHKTGVDADRHQAERQLIVLDDLGSQAEGSGQFFPCRKWSSFHVVSFVSFFLSMMRLAAASI